MRARSADEIDAQVRGRAFTFLEEQSTLHPEGIPARILTAGFDFEGRRVRLLFLGRGIFKPAAVQVPLSINTAPPKPGKPRPYDDRFEGDVLYYKYQGTDPQHPDNQGLRQAWRREIPLVYLHGLLPGRYRAVWPVYVVGDDPGSLTFSVMVDRDVASLSGPASGAGASLDRAIERRYATRQVLVRLHQDSFRARVLHAYRERCSVCRLRHPELLEAAHILEDRHPQGRPDVSNGLALCSLHHSAFDRNVLGVRPDLNVEIRRDVLDEIDGPMLVHGLQGFHGTKLGVPHRDSEKPAPDFLAERYDRFRKAS